MGSYDFINTTIRDATLTGTTTIGTGSTIATPILTSPTLTGATISSGNATLTQLTTTSASLDYNTVYGTPFRTGSTAAGGPYYGPTATYRGITAFLSITPSALMQTVISSSLQTGGQNAGILYFVNGLLVSSSAFV